MTTEAMLQEIRELHFQCAFGALVKVHVHCIETSYFSAPTVPTHKELGYVCTIVMWPGEMFSQWFTMFIPFHVMHTEMDRSKLDAGVPGLILLEIFKRHPDILTNIAKTHLSPQLSLVLD